MIVRCIKQVWRENSSGQGNPCSTISMILKTPVHHHADEAMANLMASGKEG
jgi:hypothetical protein